MILNIFIAATTVLFFLLWRREKAKQAEKKIVVHCLNCNQREIDYYNKSKMLETASETNTVLRRQVAKLEKSRDEIELSILRKITHKKEEPYDLRTNSK